MTETALFAEVEVHQDRKAGEAVCGDAFFSRRLDDDQRVVGVVSDGLGSGIKANILATMTARMALRFAACQWPMRRAADVIMDALPVCRTRRISYATFTIVDAALGGAIRVVEMGNPAFFLFRNGKAEEPPRREIRSAHWPDRVMRMAEFAAQPEDRLVVVSDGVTQAGLGGDAWKLGWRRAGCRRYIEDRVRTEPTISARRLARLVVQEARRKEDDFRAKDDITCAVFYLRRPRGLLVLTGPPFDAGRDGEIARRMSAFPGRRAVCGGTTANIVARECGREVHTDFAGARNGLPPTSTMDGIDLVTEGILTLTRTAQLLEQPPRRPSADAAGQLCELLLESDVITFLVGTRINEAHQDPTLPVDLEIRRNIVKRIAEALRSRHLKEVAVEYV